MPYRYWVSDPNAPEGEEAKIEEKSFTVPRSKPVEGNWKRRPLGGKRKPNQWLIHLKKVKTKHPNKPMKDIMKLAKASYKK